MGHVAPCACAAGALTSLCRPQPGSVRAIGGIWDPRRGALRAGASPESCGDMAFRARAFEWVAQRSRGGHARSDGRTSPRRLLLVASLILPPARPAGGGHRLGPVRRGGRVAPLRGRRWAAPVLSPPPRNWQRRCGGSHPGRRQRRRTRFRAAHGVRLLGTGWRRHPARRRAIRGAGPRDGRSLPGPRVRFGAARVPAPGARALSRRWTADPAFSGQERVHRWTGCRTTSAAAPHGRGGRPVEQWSRGVPAAGRHEVARLRPGGRPGVEQLAGGHGRPPGLDDRGGVFFAAAEMTRMPMVVTDPEPARQPDRLRQRRLSRPHGLHAGGRAGPQLPLPPRRADRPRDGAPDQGGTGRAAARSRWRF